ncbi:Maestro heat-like repeat-containing protein family member 1 [Acipenser ruthenus]|uniref:Maestro heat-like repeat-containing protein family member 1 n=1 Tax=Acipenser ruthenus TaxID=7906 RepID=A0A444TWR3_ACIRT|nr:Maestro heat-like repeat-containing protein family member 1 [Acipenser ruthenus]
MEDMEVERVSLALMDAANDKDPLVQEQVRKSMLTLGEHQPDKILSMCQDYLVKHPKLCYMGDWYSLGYIFRNMIFFRLDAIVWYGALPECYPGHHAAHAGHGKARQHEMGFLICESILEYLANLDKAPDPTVRKDTFSSEIYAAYDILFSNWLQSRETKLRLTVAEALGPMSHLMAHDKLEEQLPRLIPAILSLYKKNTEHYVISKSLCQVLDASVNMGSRLLETQLDNLLGAMHQQVCAPVDYNNPPTVKNHNEILRCFSILANTFPDRLTGFVLQRLDNSNERNRIGSLFYNGDEEAPCPCHYEATTAGQQQQGNIKQDSNKVKKVMVQVISAMAHHGYLELEGGDVLVKYIVQHCALPDSVTRNRLPSDPEDVTNESLRGMCENTLHLFTTTVGRMAHILWPGLLEYMTPVQYTNAMTPLCKSLILLGNKKKLAKDTSFMIDFNGQVSLPTPYVLLTRLLINASFPFRGRGRGVPSLNLLGVLGPNIHSNTERIWGEEIPALVQYLEESTVESIDMKKWEESLLEFLSKTVVTISDDRWTCGLVVEMTKYLPSYNLFLEEKSFLYKCIGVTLRQSLNKDVVRTQLHEILAIARHSDPIEREGIAVGVGLCASSHLDETLEKLADFGKSDVFKKASGIFGLLKDKNDVDIEKMKSTLILCYGYVALHGPEDQILGRIEPDILLSISKHFNTKDLTMKLSLIKSVGLIAQAGNVCARRQEFIFPRKQELLGVMLDFIKSEPLDVLRTPLRQQAMITCANLVKLDPVLNENENFDMIRTCLNTVFGLPPVEIDKGKDEEVLDFQQREVLYGETFRALQSLLKNVLYRDLSPDGLQSIFKHIEVWLSSPRDLERERAVKATSELLEFYLENLNVKNMVSFHNLGALLGRLAPRGSDPQSTVRKEAMDCIYTLLYIQLRYEGYALDYQDESVESLIMLRDKLDNPDHAVLYRTCSELTKIISKRLPQQQLNTLIFMLFEGLVDSQPNCARASSVVLNTILKTRGAGLQDLVPEILEVLHIRLQVITEEQVKVAVGQSILILATQHLNTVVNTLISYPLPFDNWSCEMWLALGADSTLASQIMELMIEKLNVMVPFVEKKESMLRSSMARVATSHPLAMTCALREMMLNGKTLTAVSGMFPRLFSALLVRVGSSVGVQLPKDINSNSIGLEKKPSSKTALHFDVCGVAVEALRILLARAQLDDVVKPLDQDGVWEQMKDPQQHAAGITLLARAMAKHAGPRLPEIVESLCPSLSNIYECQRITVTAFFSELLNHHVVTELMMMDVLMNSMMERISDASSTTRMLSVRGLGNMAVGSPEKVNKYAKELLAAMSSGMEERDDPSKQIALEAMSGLSKVLVYLDKKNVQLLVVYIFMKIKPFLESENDEIRSASITLLGNLSKFGSGEPVFKDQIHNVLVSLLLHLNDPSPEVVKACKFAMRECAPVMGSSQITAMFQNHLHEDRGLHYGEFINDLTKYIIQDFPSMLNFYHITVIQFFKSNWAEVRASAAMFIGEEMHS